MNCNPTGYTKADVQRIYVQQGYGPCPRCGGHPDMDEEGRYYTCFFCEDTGYVKQEIIDAMERDQTDRMEQFLPKRLGVFQRQDSRNYEYMSDDEWAIENRPGCGLFTSLVKPARMAHNVAWVTVPVDLGDMDDDIPF